LKDDLTDAFSAGFDDIATKPLDKKAEIISNKL
jgi:hypothetical protein